MPVTPQTRPVEDSVPKVNEELAVGSDLEFQHRWQSMERIVWIVLIVFLLLSLAGFFGRGPVAKATAVAADKSMVVKYEWVERYSTPSVLTVLVDGSAVHNEAVQLWASETLVKPLGNQRVVPQPAKSQIGNGGVLYTFPASSGPGSIEFQTQPSKLGHTSLKLQVVGHSMVELNIYVVP